MVDDERPESTTVVPVPEYACVPEVGVVGAVPTARLTTVVLPDPLVQEAVIEAPVIPESERAVGAVGGRVVPQTLVYVVEYAVPS